MVPQLLGHSLLLGFHQERVSCLQKLVRVVLFHQLLQLVGVASLNGMSCTCKQLDALEKLVGCCNVVSLVLRIKVIQNQVKGVFVLTSLLAQLEVVAILKDAQQDLAENLLGAYLASQVDGLVPFHS